MKIPMKFWKLERNVQVVTDLADQRTETFVGNEGRPGTESYLYRILKKSSRVF